MVFGEWIGCIGMLEFSVGFDLKFLKIVVIDMGDYYLINGFKIFIINGYVVDFVLCVCCINKGIDLEGISLIMIEKDREGFIIG